MNLVQKKLMKFSLIMPTWNGSATVIDTLYSLSKIKFDQHQFEVIVCDDCSTDTTVFDIKKFKKKNKIKNLLVIENNKNLGYPGNISRASKYSSGEYIFLIGQDDLLSYDILEHYNQILNDKKIGAICRPYYAFDSDFRKPIRYKKLLHNKQKHPEIITIFQPFDRVHQVFNTLDQLSGLCMKKSFIQKDFHKDVFPCHVYPFMSVFLKHPIVYTNKYLVAVRVNSSQCLNVSSIYDKSPVQSWIDLFESFDINKNLKKYMIKNFVCSNWIGLFQIRNYSKKPYKFFLREVFIMLKHNKLNFINIYFIITFFICLLTPRKYLSNFVNYIKENINSKLVPNIDTSKF
jgi:glycosyltransferase involved in cell wall biosynthesis